VSFWTTDGLKMVLIQPVNFKNYKF
jgi:hypothetical protein